MVPTEGAPSGGSTPASSADTAGSPHPHSTEYYEGEIMVVLITLLAIVTCCVVFHEYQRFLQQDHKDHTFNEYLEYRFIHWLTTRPLAWGFVLLVITLFVVVTGALIYGGLTGKSPFTQLTRTFDWCMQSNVHEQPSLTGRIMALSVTLCGLIIVSLLLAIVTDSFYRWMNDVREGKHDVVEGDHIVVLGYTDFTKTLLEELATAKVESGGGIIGLLDARPKMELEDTLESLDLDMKNSTLVVRSGRVDETSDLQRIAAHTASVVVVLADTSVSREESDAKAIRILLTMKCQNWPDNGYVVVQCSVASNKYVMQDILKDKVEIVVVGDIVARIMVQSAHQAGLTSIFKQLLTFEGCEFYKEEWPNLNGLPWKDVVFRFPHATPVGVMDKNGQAQLNPGNLYKIKEGDKIIVLAEHAKSYEAVGEPFFEQHSASIVASRRGFSRRDSGKFGHEVVQSKKAKSTTAFHVVPRKVLVLGWNDKIGMLLMTLESELCPGSKVDIYSGRPIDKREETIANIQKRRSHKFQNIEISHLYVPKRNVTSRMMLKTIPLETYENFFVLADTELEGSKSLADEKTIALLVQLQGLITCPDSERGIPRPGSEEAEIAEHNKSKFSVVAEILERSTAQQLNGIGLRNHVNSNLLVSQTLAIVSIDREANQILSELMQNDGCELAVRKLDEFLHPDEGLPDRISFVEIICRVQCTVNAIVIGWSRGDKEHRKWELNPEDKTTQREWTRTDKLAMLCAAEDIRLSARSPMSSARMLSGRDHPH